MVHGTRDSISLISYAGCLGLSPVYFSENSLLSVRHNLKKRKIYLKTFLGFKVVQGNRCWYPRKARQQCLLSYAANVSICNHFRARLVDRCRNRTFWRGYTQIWCTRTEDSLNLGGQTLHRWNLRFMPNILYAGCPGLSWIVWRNSLLKCVWQP